VGFYGFSVDFGFCLEVSVLSWLDAWGSDVFGVVSGLVGRIVGALIGQHA
jgi:hypothetical protein